jgi:hypothetical protein
MTFRIQPPSAVDLPLWEAGSGPWSRMQRPAGRTILDHGPGSDSAPPTTTVVAGTTGDARNWRGPGVPVLRVRVNSDRLRA